TKTRNRRTTASSGLVIPVAVVSTDDRLRHREACQWRSNVAQPHRALVSFRDTADPDAARLVCAPFATLVAEANNGTGVPDRDGDAFSHPRESTLARGGVCAAGGLAVDDRADRQLCFLQLAECGPVRVSARRRHAEHLDTTRLDSHSRWTTAARA